MKFLLTPLLFVLAALLVVGIIHGDLLIVLKDLSAVHDLARASCAIAVFVGFFVALLRG